MMAYMHIKCLKEEIAVTESEFNDMGHFTHWHGEASGDDNVWSRGLTAGHNGLPGTEAARRCRLAMLHTELREQHLTLVRHVEASEEVFYGPFCLFKAREKSLNQLMGAVCLVHTSVLACYNTADIPEDLLNWLHSILTFLHIADVCSRAYQCGGVLEYLHIRRPVDLTLNQYHRRTLPNRQFTRRVEFVFVAGSCLGLFGYTIVTW